MTALAQSWLPGLSRASCRRFLLLASFTCLLVAGAYGLLDALLPPAWRLQITQVTVAPQQVAAVPPTTTVTSQVVSTRPATTTAAAAAVIRPATSAAAAATVSRAPGPWDTSLLARRRRQWLERTERYREPGGLPKWAPGPTLEPATRSRWKLVATPEPAKASPAPPDGGGGRKLPSALCIVGNIRTFPLTLERMERFAVANGLDVYMVLQKGAMTGSTWLRWHSKYFGKDAEEALIRELRGREGRPPEEGRMTIKKITVVENGGCGEYNRDFAPREKHFSTLCRETHTHSQVRWCRTCFSMVLDSGLRYARIARTRPDVGIFDDIILDNYPKGHEPYGLYALWKPGAPNVGGDWFWFMEFRKLLPYWTWVEQSASRTYAQWPFLDFIQFQQVAGIFHQFPAVIVRGDHFAECCRFQPDERTRFMGSADSDAVAKAAEGRCERALQKGVFAKVPAFLQALGHEAEMHGPFRTCNPDSR